MMGGSGGSYGGRSTSRDTLKDLVRRTDGEADDAAYEVEVNGVLADALREFNDRNIARVRRHIDAVKETLEVEGDGSIDLVFGGSVRKHTYVDGLSDVDVLAVLNRSELVDKPPQEVLEEFARRLRHRFPRTDVTAGKIAVTIQYSDNVELQVLPAVATSTGLRIARSVDQGWSKVVRPDAFAKKLTAVNEALGRKVVPVIKLFKAFFEEDRPRDMKLSGYHAESLAIAAFEGYAGKRTYKDMLHHLCRSAAERVRTPIKDRTGQSLHVDDYLGPQGSRERLAISTRLERLAKRLEDADRRRDSDEWRQLLGDE
jgi:SAM-dependent methyltransferase